MVKMLPSSLFVFYCHRYFKKRLEVTDVLLSWTINLNTSQRSIPIRRLLIYSNERVVYKYLSDNVGTLTETYVRFVKRGTNRVSYTYFFLSVTMIINNNNNLRQH